MYTQQADYTFAATSIEIAEAQSQLYRSFRGISRPGHLSFRVALDKLPCADHVFDLDNLELRFTQDGDVWCCEACGLASYGHNPTEASISFCEDFGVLWDEIAQQPDEALTTSAQQMKKCILSAVKSVR